MAEIKLLGEEACASERGKRGPTGPTGPSGAGATGPTGPTGSTVPPILAAAIVNSDGTYITQTGFTGAIGTPATGQYQLTLENPPPSPPGSNALLVLITIAGSAGGQNSYLFDSDSVVHAYTFDAAGAAANKIFSITVFDLSSV